MRAKTAVFKKTLPPPGVHIARLVQIIDWGDQVDKFAAEGRAKVELIWELPKVLHVFNEDKGPQPLIVDRKYGNTYGTAKKRSDLGKAIEGMIGSGFEDTDENPFELDALIGYVCQMQTVNETDESGYENCIIKSLMALPEGMDPSIYPEYNDQFVLDLDNFNPEIWELLPQWKRDKIATTKQYALAISGGGPQDDAPDQVPTAEQELFAEEIIAPPVAQVNKFQQQRAAQPVTAPPKQPVQAPAKVLVPGQGFKQPATKTAAVKPPAKVATTPVKTGPKKFR